MRVLEGVVVAERREVQPVGLRLVFDERGADLLDRLARQAADDVAALGPAVGRRRGGVAVVAILPVVPVGGGQLVAVDHEVAAVLVEQVLTVELEGVAQQVGGRGRLLDDADQRVRAGHGHDAAFAGAAQVAVEQLEMVGHRVGVGGVGALDHAAGVTLDGHPLALALKVHGFDGVTPEVNTHDGTGSFRHGSLTKQKA